MLFGPMPLEGGETVPFILTSRDRDLGFGGRSQDDIEGHLHVGFDEKYDF